MYSEEVEILRRELEDLKVQVKYMKWTVEFIIVPLLLCILGRVLLVQ